MGEKVRLRSSDGLLFEVDPDVAHLSPIIVQIQDMDDSDEEVPLPMVRASVLSHIVDLCKSYVSKGYWDKAMLLPIGHDHEQLENLTWAANYLCLEELMAIVLGSLAHLVREQGPEETCVSLAAMRKALLLQSMRLPNETLRSLLCALAFHAVRGDIDSLAALRPYVDHSSLLVCIAAIRGVGRLAPVDDALSMARLQRQLRNQNTEVALAAFAALTTVAARGNKEVISIVSEKSVHADAATRCAAMEASARVAVHGDARVLANLKRGMDDSHGSVRKAAVESFVQLVTQSDPLAALEVIRCLEDMDDSVRQAAIRSVGVVMEGNNDMAYGALTQKLEHRYWWVSWAAAKALAEVAPKDEPIVIDAIVPRLAHESPTVRQVALQTLTDVASKGNIRIMESLKEYLLHRNAGVRRTAMKTLAKFGKGERTAIRIASKLLDHPKERVRKSAGEALKLVDTNENEYVRREICERLKHARLETRLAALSVVSQIGDRNEPWVVEAICLSLLDKDGEVQEAAVTAFDKLVDRGHSHAIFSLLGLLDTSQQQCLQAMLFALPKVAGSGDKSLHLVSTLLEQQSIIVRSNLFDMHMQMSCRSYRHCDYAPCNCWDGATVGSTASAPKKLDDAQKFRQGVQAATWALTLCLLQPGANLADAVKTALERVGACGEQVAADLKACMTHHRWFIEWPKIEFLCTAALAEKGAPVCSTTTAKAERRLRTDKECTGASHPALHRPNCPCVAESKQPSKRARLGGA